MSASNLRKSVFSGNLNPFVSVAFEPDILKKKIQTPAIKNTQNPVWDFKSQIPLDLSDVSVMDVELKISVNDMNPISKTSVGDLIISLINLLDRPGRWLNEYFTLTIEDPNNHSIVCGNIYLQLCWVPLRINLSAIEEPEDLR
jgi:Ca2+-dependent lipid-binding protein